MEISQQSLKTIKIIAPTIIRKLTKENLYKNTHLSKEDSCRRATRSSDTVALEKKKSHEITACCLSLNIL